jgi:predicted Rossmann fold flavoprotein
VAESDALDVLVIGGGAAGLFCALTAGQRGRRVRVIEHANRCGKKILMSGGGRCNFTNTGTRPENFLSDNPHFCRSALARYRPEHFIAMVERHGIAYHEKELGQLFCDESSKQIVKMLLDECADAGVEVRTQCVISAVEKTDHGFRLRTTQGVFCAPALVVARAVCRSRVWAPLGSAIPWRGSSVFACCRPAQGLVPLTLRVRTRIAGGILPVSRCPSPPRRASRVSATRC